MPFLAPLLGVAFEAANNRLDGAVAKAGKQPAPLIAFLAVAHRLVRPVKRAAPGVPEFAVADRARFRIWNWRHCHIQHAIHALFVTMIRARFPQPVI